MSYELIVNGKSKGQIASNNGWFETTAYLDRAGAEARTFAESGRSEHPQTLKRDLEELLNQAGLSESARSVISEIVRLLPKAGSVLVSQ